MVSKKSPHHQALNSKEKTSQKRKSYKRKSSLYNGLFLSSYHIDKQELLQWAVNTLNKLENEGYLLEKREDNETNFLDSTEPKTSSPSRAIENNFLNLGDFSDPGAFSGLNGFSHLDDFFNLNTDNHFPKSTQADALNKQGFQIDVSSIRIKACKEKQIAYRTLSDSIYLKTPYKYHLFFDINHCDPMDNLNGFSQLRLEARAIQDKSLGAKDKIFNPIEFNLRKIEPIDNGQRLFYAFQFKECSHKQKGLKYDLYLVGKELPSEYKLNQVSFKILSKKPKASIKKLANNTHSRFFPIFFDDKKEKNNAEHNRLEP